MNLGVTGGISLYLTTPMSLNGRSPRTTPESAAKRIVEILKRHASTLSGDKREAWLSGLDRALARELARAKSAQPRRTGGTPGRIRDLA